MSDGRVHATSIKFSPSASSSRRFRLCLGSPYVNDLNLFGRAYQVTAQADSKFRLRPDDIGELKIRNANGEMVPLCTLVQLQAVTGPDKVVRYNMNPSAETMARYGVTCVCARPRASHRCHSVPKRSEKCLGVRRLSKIRLHLPTRRLSDPQIR